MSSNYFVCTLGEAAKLHGAQRFHDANHLIQEQSKINPNLPAIGFFRVQKTQHETVYQHEVFTFRQVEEGVTRTSQLLSRDLNTAHGGTVALLCSSSPEFLFTWLGLIALGHPVLLIATECAPQDVSHLCKSCEVCDLITDAPNRDLVEQSLENQADGTAAHYRCIMQPFEGKGVFDVLKAGSPGEPRFTSPHGTDAAYFHHTSGTSGTPRPLVQSHHGAVGALPSFDGSKEATFTTTPLFHGGPADLFRAWTSNAMIWLFPSKDVPITASNITRCLESAQGAAESGIAPPIKYFAAVPYVLESMLGRDDAARWLSTMDLVSVGGAALPQDVGDSLVERGVNMVSRFGSAECGFLMSSHRDYTNDKEWQYLRRNDSSAGYLTFESRHDGLSELVVLSGWPHRAKSNRDDGSYATSDLFEPHPSIPNAWKYHSRADSQLTLATGKKFDANQVENLLLSNSELLDHALVFGDKRPYPGALLFRSAAASDLTDAELIKQMEPAIEKANSSSQSQATISKSMLIPLPYGADIDESSKGTVLRKRVEDRYRDRIEAAYNDDVAVEQPLDKGDLTETIQTIVTKAVPRGKSHLTAATDLYTFGVDSVAGLHIRNSLQRLLPEDADRLPVDVIEECGSIEKIATYIDDIRHGHVGALKNGVQDDSDEMLGLVGKYSQFDEGAHVNGHSNTGSVTTEDNETVVLTGATGSLGAHILELLRRDSTVTRIYCLVRGADEHAAQERVRKALLQRGLATLDDSDPKIIVVPAKLHQDDLGLDSAVYQKISREATSIMHLAWPVNFQMKLRSFERDGVAGLRNLIQLSLCSPRPQCPKFAFCSSTASSIANTSDPIPERVLFDPSSASQTGYSKSKWVAEQICLNANEASRLKDRISIFRVGQLSSDSESGVWNVKEAWPLMLSTIPLVGCLPDLGEEALAWLPVNMAAQAMIDGAIKMEEQHSLPVLHVLNNSPKPTWNDMIRSLHKRVDFELVPPVQWVQKLEEAMERGSNHPSLQLIDLWKASYATKDDQQEGTREFCLDETKKLIPIMRKSPILDDEYFGKMWRWIESNMIS